MNILTAFRSGIKKLREQKIDSAHLDAAVLLAHVLKKSKAFLLAHPEARLSPTAAKTYTRLLHRRSRREPVAYLTGHKEFFGFDFLVNNRVLIPRPESELLVEQAISFARNLKTRTSKHIIADIGTGSGCLAISLAKYLPSSTIIATDISAASLVVAKKNARQHGVTKKIRFLKGDLLKPLRRDGRQPDIIIANLPYGTKRGLAQVPFEPAGAIDGGRRGLEIMHNFLRQLTGFTPKVTLMEISPEQTVPLQKLIKKILPEAAAAVMKDLSGRNRIITITTKQAL